ncbi:hypothetical protein [Pajaroellobacter abortibovis]|uniref:Uncharacterized protein n=1 Tax=Pajaroellobacter abortibovis TaxID=1882918 RepID=A0A1L6MVS6_9BACT|nr:hypothetical protein [Pajaroellobacter abortibovis]APR99588.1 hypothetical protein BCY86_02010 [Pajaroellobacter abortibovis]
MTTLTRLAIDPHQYQITHLFKNFFSQKEPMQEYRDRILPPLEICEGEYNYTIRTELFGMTEVTSN